MLSTHQFWVGAVVGIVAWHLWMKYKEKKAA